MTKRLFNYQQEPRPFGMKTRRLNAVTRILLAIFAMMLIPQRTLAQVDYYMYDGSKFVKTRADSPSALSGSQSTVNDFSLGAGTYYVPSGSPVTYSGCLVIDGTVNIILCDGATLNANHGIAVGYDATLNIYGQEKGTGQLIASGYNFNSGGTDYYKGPAIGGYYRQMGNNSATTSQCGKIFIHGGIITASSYSPIGSFDDAAGIGGWGADGASNGPRELTVYGGKVTATGGLYGAGIGGGRNGEGGTVNIYGGEVIATGGDGDRSNNAPARGIGAGVSTAVVAAAPGNGTLTLGSGVTCYGDNTNTDPTGLNPQTTVSTRYQYMKTDRTYDLAVGVTTVKASNASNINSASTATASFNPITNTLKLNKLKADGPIVSNLANLTIELNDANELTGTQGYIESNNTSATLTIKKGSDGYLTLTNSTGTSAVSGFASVTLEDVYLSASNCCTYDGSTKAYVYPGLDYSGWYNVQDLDFTTDVYYPLWVGSVQVKGDKLDDVWDSGNKEVSFDPVNNALTLNGVEIDSSNGIETTLPNLTILLNGSNSVNTCTSYHYGPIYSMAGTGKLTIKKAQNAKSSLLTLSTCYDENTPIRVVRGFNSVEVLDDLLCDITLGNGTTLNDANTLGATVYMNFPLWVSGTQVTSANAGNFYKSTKNNSPTVSFDPDNNILKLNGPTNIWVDGSVPGIKSGLDNLTVYLEYGTSFQFNGSATASAFEGVNGTENIAFDTDPASPAGLFVTSAQADIFKNFNSITYNNGLFLFKKVPSNLGAYPASIIQKPWSGYGLPGDPFLIKTPKDISTLATFVNTNEFDIDQCFKVDDNVTTLNCSNEGTMESIGKSYKNSFKGKFNGNNKTISNITTPYGLFANVVDGTIEDLTISNCTVSGGGASSAAAGLVGDIRGSGKIGNCHVVGGAISNRNNNNLTSLGGLVGYIHGSTIQNCTVVNSTVTQEGAFSFNAGAGGLVGRTYDGPSISGCSVENTQITAVTTGNYEIYAGAIVGWREQSPQLNKNYYDYQVTVTTQKGNDSAVTKSGNVQRGLGDGDDEFENVIYNLVDGAVLTGLQTITLTANTDGTIDCLEGYYRYVENTNSTNKTVTVYALPSTQSNQGTKIKATSPLQYDTPTITISDLKSGDKVNYLASSDPSITAPHAIWEIEMPAENVTATIAYPIDFSNGNRAFAITNPVNATKVYDGSPISITQITTKPSATSDDNTKVTLDISKNDFTITGYNKMSSGAATPLGTTAPTDAGNYQVIISGNGNNSSGTATVNFTITPADGTVSASDTETTYDGSPKAYDGVVPGYKGTVSIKYYQTTTDRTNGNALAGAPIDANTYYVRVTQTDPNYTSAPADATFTIKPKSIASAVITLSESSLAFNNTTQVPTIQSVYDGNVPLNLNTDYTVKSNTGGKDVGPYEVIIQGTGNYDAATTASTTFNITVMNATPDVQVATTPAIVYDGNKKEPAVTVTVSGVQLTTADYTVVYSDNINAGINTAKATVTLKHNYSGSAVKNFTIDQREVELGWSNTTFTYDGDPHVPTAKVNNPAQKTDVCNVTVDGAQTNAGSYTATASRLSNNNYKLPTTATARTTTFKINPKSMGDGSITVEVTGTPYTYDGNAKTPTITVKDGNNPLTINTDYSVSYQKKDDNGNYANVNEVKDAGTYKAVVTGANNYKENKSSNEFSVGKAAINGVTVSIAGWNYGDAANSPFVTVGNPGNATVKYEYKQENAGDDTYTETVPTNADTYIVRATVPATPNYKEAQGTTKFTIVPCSLAVVTIEPIDEQTYKGSPITPVPTMYIMSGTNKVSLKEGTDFDCTSYANNTNAAEITATSAPTVTITCKGNFKGQQDVKFTIKPLTATLTWSDTEFTYDGNSHKPTAKVSNIISPDGCTVEVLGEQTDAGSYTATAARLSNNNYKLSNPAPTKDFIIKPVDLSASSAVLTIDPINDEVYTGNDITPTPNVYIKLGNSSNNTQLIAGTNFTYGYANNKDAADKNDSNAPTVTINGTGNYTGSATTKFTILDRVASINLGGRTFRTYYNASETNRVPDDIQAYIVTGVNGNEVTVQPVSYIPKQTPVLLEAKAGAKSVKNKADDFTTNKLAYATNDVAANGNQYLLYNGEFVRASGTISGKVYLDLGSNSPARTYTINTNNTTAIESVFDEEADGEEKWYDMQGRQINKPTKAGLYIRNGQKVVIKNK